MREGVGVGRGWWCRLGVVFVGGGLVEGLGFVRC